MRNLNNIEAKELNLLNNCLLRAKKELDKALEQMDSILDQRKDLEYAIECVSETEKSIAEAKENGEDTADLEAELASDKLRIARESERLAKLVEKQYICSSLLDVVGESQEASDFIEGKAGIR
jgi:hypothetical protein